MDKVRRTVRTVKMSSDSFQYRGSIFFLIFFLVIFCPIGILLLIRNLARLRSNTTSYLEYTGSWKWVFFWGIFFFPISFILLFFNGISLIEEKQIIEELTQPEEDTVINRKR